MLWGLKTENDINNQPVFQPSNMLQFINQTYFGYKINGALKSRLQFFFFCKLYLYIFIRNFSFIFFHSTLFAVLAFQKNCFQNFYMEFYILFFLFATLVVHSFGIALFPSILHFFVIVLHTEALREEPFQMLCFILPPHMQISQNMC